VQGLTDDRAIRYLRGSLPEAERDAFEVHVLECDDCSDLLEAARVARDVLADEGPDRRVRPSPVVRMASLAAGLAAVAAASFVLLRPTVPPAPAVASVAPSPVREPTVPPRDFAALAEVVPPVYVPLTVRSASARDEAFDRAMGHYARREYGAAADGLRTVVRDSPNRGDAWLFLGVSDLMAGELEKAREELDHAARLGQPPYAHAAAFFLAKAELKRGEADAARKALADVTASGGSYAPEARRLLDRLERLGATGRP
jgi:tetratricopeptide (TPR) repeat protein